MHFSTILAVAAASVVTPAVFAIPLTVQPRDIDHVYARLVARMSPLVARGDVDGSTLTAIHHLYQRSFESDLYRRTTPSGGSGTPPTGGSGRDVHLQFAGGILGGKKPANAAKQQDALDKTEQFLQTGDRPQIVKDAGIQNELITSAAPSFPLFLRINLNAKSFSDPPHTSRNNPTQHITGAAYPGNTDPMTHIAHTETADPTKGSLEPVQDPKYAAQHPSVQAAGPTKGQADRIVHVPSPQPPSGGSK
ncbi:hypothetical protein K474DRAFT_656625 [Panus rudis PR-1116 ss-1]|nr:hypothetical protein K474DRAFT_656625 [Panus rudis PR-1116 ss-1]